MILGHKITMVLNFFPSLHIELFFLIPKSKGHTGEVIKLQRLK